MPTTKVDTSLPPLRAVRVLDRLRLKRGLPERIVIDHGTEFISKVMDQRARNIVICELLGVKNPYLAHIPEAERQCAVWTYLIVGEWPLA